MNNESQWKDSESTVNIHKIVGATLSNLPWFVGSVIITFIIAFLYLRYTTSVYQINAEILIKDDKTEGVINENVLQGLGLDNGMKNINNEMRMLSNHALVARVVRALNLNIHYSEPGRVTTSEIFDERPFNFVLPEEIIDSFTGNKIYKIKKQGDKGYKITDIKDPKNKREWTGVFGDTLLLPIGPVVLVRTQYGIGANIEYTVTITSVERATNKYAGSITVSNPNRQSSILLLSLKDQLPRRGEVVLNKLIEEYQSQNINDKNEIANNTLNFIDSELTIISDSLGGVEKTMAEYKKQNDVTDLSKEGQVLVQNANQYEQEMAKDEMQLGLLEAQEKYIKAHEYNKKLIPASLVTEGGTFNSIIGQYNQLFQKRAELLLSSTENNPIVVNIDKQLDSLQQDLKITIASVKLNLQGRIDAYKKRAGYFNSEVRQIPTKERIYLGYARQQAIKQEMYLFLLKKREETAIGRSTTVANSRVVEPAKAMAAPYKPVRATIFLAALIVGLLVPGVIVYFKNVLNTRIKGRSDINAVSSLAIAGEIGHNLSEDTLAVVPGSRSVIAEQFRALRTNLEFLLGGSDEKVIMITSSMSGEGKSFISLNLSSTLALSGKKVVLMELDLRKPKISKYLGIDNNLGFSNFAIGQVEYNQIMVPSGVQDNLYIIPSGPIPPNPSELIILQSVANLFLKLREDFDYIVIDTAPIGFVTDAQLLNRYADTALYVIRQNYTYKQQIQFADELYQTKKLSKLNLVVNDVKVSRGYGYGYGYGYYSYGYGYGYGYGSYGSYFDKSEVKNKGLIQNFLQRFKKNTKKDLV